MNFLKTLCQHSYCAAQRFVRLKMPLRLQLSPCLQKLHKEKVALRLKTKQVLGQMLMLVTVLKWC